MALVGLGFGSLPAVCASRTDLRAAISVTSRGVTLNRMRADYSAVRRDRACDRCRTPDGERHRHAIFPKTD